MKYLLGSEIFCYGFLSVIVGVLLIWLIQTIVKKIKRSKNPTQGFEQIPDIEPRYDEAGFVDFCYSVMPRKKRIKSAEEDLKEAERRADVALANLQNNCNCEVAAEWRDARMDEALKRARLKILQEGKEMDSCTKEEFLADFEQIRFMRGVKQVYIEEGKLYVVVRVAYPCKGLLYDAGDFAARFYKDKSFVVVPVRTKWEPYIAYNDDGICAFCFGDERQEEIVTYLYDGRIVEAMELIIDSLYYIDNHEYERIPYKLEPIRVLTRKEKKEFRRRKY